MEWNFKMDEEYTTSEDWIPRFTVGSSTLRTLASQELTKISYQYEIRKLWANREDIAFFDWFHAVRWPIFRKFDIDEEFLFKIIDNERMSFVSRSISSWIRFHIHQIYFDSNKKIDVLNCLEDLAFNHNGSVSYLNTAKNLLIGDKLSLVEKYRFACLNCLVEDIENLWPLISNDPHVNDLDADPNPLIDYWTCLMKGELPQMFNDNDNDSCEWRSIFLLGAWPSIEYALDKVTKEVRVEEFVFLLEYFTGYLTERSSVFLKLNNDKDLFDGVMEQISITAVFYGLRFSDHFKNILVSEVWNEMKYFISADQFLNLISSFCFDKSLRYKHRYDFSSDPPYQFAHDIWISAPYRLKQAITFEEIEGIFNRFSNFCERVSVKEARDLDMRFFLAVLADLRIEFRNSLWCRYWTKLIVPGDSIFLNQAMKLCFNTEEEIIRFKETEMMNFANIEYFCSKFIMDECIPPLDDYLNFCSTNIDRVRVRALKLEIIKLIQDTIFDHILLD